MYPPLTGEPHASCEIWQVASGLAMATYSTSVRWYSLRHCAPNASCAAPAGMSNNSPEALASNPLDTYVVEKLGLTLYSPSVAMVCGSSTLNMFNGTQPVMTLPGVPHLTTPSVSRNDGPSASRRPA